MHNDRPSQCFVSFVNTFAMCTRGAGIDEGVILRWITDAPPVPGAGTGCFGGAVCIRRLGVLCCSRVLGCGSSLLAGCETGPTSMGLRRPLPSSVIPICSACGFGVWLPLSFCADFSGLRASKSGVVVGCTTGWAAATSGKEH